MAVAIELAKSVRADHQQETESPVNGQTNFQLLAMSGRCRTSNQARQTQRGLQLQCTGVAHSAEATSNQMISACLACHAMPCSV